MGHNVGVDWRLLSRHFPDVKPVGLLDTLRLARALHPEQKQHNLTAWVGRLHLCAVVSVAAVGSVPHRALWDATAAALLLPSLLADKGEPDLSLSTLAGLAGVPLQSRAATARVAPIQAPLWE